MNDNLTNREQLSALMDGQLQGNAWLQALQYAEQDEGRAAWHAYHVVGDVLRAPELAHGAVSSSIFLARFQERLAHEPVPVSRLPEAPVALAPPPPVRQPLAANAAVFRWKMLAGFASLAVVVSLGWNSWDRLQQSGTPAGTQLAAAAPAASQGRVTAADAAPSAAPSLMLRDPRLDELLAAHKQFGGAAALQMPAGFLRNATFEAPAR